MDQFHKNEDNLFSHQNANAGNGTGLQTNGTATSQNNNIPDRSSRANDVHNESDIEPVQNLYFDAKQSIFAASSRIHDNILIIGNSNTEGNMAQSEAMR